MGKIAGIEKRRERVIARVIGNTLRQKRPSNLIDIANDIEFLKNEFGTLEKVSKIVGVSSDMLRQFLTVNRLSPEVRTLVKDRRLDSVTIIHKLQKFDEDEQRIISKEVMAGRLTSEDVRALVTLKNKFSELSIHELISKLLSSKDIKLYVANFQIPSRHVKVRALQDRFEHIVGKKELVAFDVDLDELIGSIELTKVGLRKLRQAAKQRNLTLRKFVDLIVDELWKGYKV